jgi:hypothetical protein
MNLQNGIRVQILFDLQNQGPKDGPRSSSRRSPKSVIREIFSLENS